MEAIILENVVKTYKIGEVETRALDGVSLELAEVNLQHWSGLPDRERPPCCN